MDSNSSLLDEIFTRGKDSNVSHKSVKEHSITPVRALSTVINYIITDAFGLDAEESMWLGYNLNQVLDPLNDLLPTYILAAVNREMSDEEYSTRLMNLLSDPNRIQSTAVVNTDGVKYATLNDWVEGTSEIILGSYPRVRPMYKSRIVGSIHGLFTELGLTNDLKKSRASLYLPNSVRFLLESRRGEG